MLSESAILNVVKSQPGLKGREITVRLNADMAEVLSILWNPLFFNSLYRLRPARELRINEKAKVMVMPYQCKVAGSTELVEDYRPNKYTAYEHTRYNN